MNIRQTIAASAVALAALGVSTANASIFVSTQDDIFLAGYTGTIPSGSLSGTYPYFENQTTGTYGNTNPGAGNLPYAVSAPGGHVTISNVSTETGTSCGTGCNFVMTANGETQYSSSTSVTYGPAYDSISGYSVVSYTGNRLALVGDWGTATGAGATPFFIGNAGGTFTAPAGDTVLYLGTVDAFGNSPYGAGTYNDNQGGFFLTASVPEPAIWTMMLLGFFGLGFMLRRTRNALTLASV
jgi:PEP-CTERM motif-containing protein